MSSTTEHLRPDDTGVMSIPDFARIAGLPEQDVRELLDDQLLAPGQIDLRSALALREAVRLQHDFDLDLFSTGLLAGYIRRVAQLQAEIDQLRAQRPGRTVYTEVSFTAVEMRGRV